MAARTGTTSSRRAARKERPVVEAISQTVIWLVGGFVVFVAYGYGVLRVGLPLILVLLAAVALTLAAMRLIRKQSTFVWLRHPWRPVMRWLTVQAVLRAIMWVLVGLTATLAIPRGLADNAGAIEVAIWLAVAVLSLIGLLPVVKATWVNLLGVTLVIGLLVAHTVRISTPAPDAVSLANPVQGRWVVAAGGRSALVSPYYVLPQQRYSLDLLVPFERSATAPPTQLADFPAYGQPVVAPAAGTVVRASDGLIDQPVGSGDAAHPAGNYVVIDLGSGRFVLLGQLQQGTVVVHVGERVAVGDRIGSVGNSGSSSEPHLHIQAQSGPDLSGADGKPMAGLVTYPLNFADASRTRGGSTHRPADGLRINDLVAFGG